MQNDYGVEGHAPFPPLVIPNVNNRIGWHWLQACALYPYPGIGAVRSGEDSLKGGLGEHAGSQDEESWESFHEQGSFEFQASASDVGGVYLPFLGDVAAYSRACLKTQGYHGPGMYSTTSPWLQYQSNSYMSYKWVGRTVWFREKQ